MNMNSALLKTREELDGRRDALKNLDRILDASSKILETVTGLRTDIKNVFSGRLEDVITKTEDALDFLAKL